MRFAEAAKCGREQSGEKGDNGTIRPLSPSRMQSHIPLTFQPFAVQLLELPMDVSKALSARDFTRDGTKISTFNDSEDAPVTSFGEPIMVGFVMLRQWQS